MWRRRIVKSAWELELYRTLGRITAAGFRAGLEAIALGVSEREIERRMWRAFIDGGADASPVGGQLMIRSGRERYGTFCGRASARTLEAGDQIILAGGPALSGYHIDIHRFACVPPAPDLQHELHAQSEAGLTAAIEATRPGVAAKTVFKAARDAMRRRAATAVIPWRVFGHGVGLDNYEPPMISEDDETILEKGMVLALEVPAYDIPAGRVLGAFLEDCIVVTDSGAEVLTAGVGRALWAG
jgi:Xaa-Pro aminopeptidase